VLVERDDGSARRREVVKIPERPGSVGYVPRFPGRPNFSWAREKIRTAQCNCLPRLREHPANEIVRAVAREISGVPSGRRAGTTLVHRFFFF
jgi:hypothetical protein